MYWQLIDTLPLGQDLDDGFEILVYDAETKKYCTAKLTKRRSRAGNVTDLFVTDDGKRIDRHNATHWCRLHPPNLCSVCGGLMAGTRERNYCSHYCGRVVRLGVRECFECKKLFVPDKDGVRFCSGTCAHINVEVIAKKNGTRARNIEARVIAMDELRKDLREKRKVEMDEDLEFLVSRLGRGLIGK